MAPVTRRQLLTAAAVAAPPLASCASSRDTYAAVAAQTWRPFAAPSPDRRALLRELVRYATLAASSHNTQCWAFALTSDRISIVPDFARRCPAVDPDDHHLFVSLGCAAENLIWAASTRGLHSEVSFDEAAGGAVHIGLSAARPLASPLFAAIPQRQSCRAEYDGRPLETRELRQLEAAGTGHGVRVVLLTARTDVERVLDYVVEGNTRQMNDRAFMAELVHWIRFSDEEAAAKRDGLFSRASGSPSLPRWLAVPLLKLVFSAPGENAKYTQFIRSSSGVAVFVSERSDREHWVETGRCFERFALQATALGVRTAMINQPVEVAALRPQFAAALGFGTHRPDLVMRFGHAAAMPRSLRRPVAAVLVE